MHWVVDNPTCWTYSFCLPLAVVTFDRKFSPIAFPFENVMATPIWVEDTPGPVQTVEYHNKQQEQAAGYGACGSCLTSHRCHHSVQCSRRIIACVAAGVGVGVGLAEAQTVLQEAERIHVVMELGGAEAIQALREAIAKHQRDETERALKVMINTF